MDHTYAYGLWPMVVINSLVIIIFAFSFSHPTSKRDWRTFGAFSAFIVALFTEMYGFPLSIYLLSGWLSSRFPGLNLFSHDAGHIWYTVFGFTGDPHTNPLHILSNVLIVGGFILLAASWRVLYRAQTSQALAVTGPYAYVRHPQYIGFILIMLGFLFQWPAITTLIMFPILVWIYARLARREEQDTLRAFATPYEEYMAFVPAFIPRLSPWRQLTTEEPAPGPVQVPVAVNSEKHRS